jgi:tetratricopeptide (TPR) repeat protein
LAQPPAPPGDQAAAEEQAGQFADAARKAFAAGDYPAALSWINKAVALMPNDSVLHELRALVLFALQKYDAAAVAAYAVLSVGPGWDWTTLIGLYADADVYTQQLRALERYCSERPNFAAAQFLLAYHYLTCGYTAAAAHELTSVVQLNPKDRLAAQLLASLAAPPAAAPAAPPPPPAPVDAANLAGDWHARQPDGSTVSLSLTADHAYTWQFTRQGQTRKFSGPYTLADNLLVLKQGANPVMVGQVALLGDGKLTFKLPSDNPADPGLTFSR